MKKTIFYLLSACLLVGCTSTKKPEANNAQEKEEKEQYVMQDIDLPDFDYTPINYDNKGYIVSVDGQFGMMDAYGNWMKQTEYGSLFTALMPHDNITYCAVPTGEPVLSGGFSFNSLFNEERTTCSNSGFGGVVTSYICIKEENGNYVPLYQEMGSSGVTEKAVTDATWKEVSPNGNAMKLPFILADGNIDQNQYFVGMVDGTIYGPFDKYYEVSISEPMFDVNDTFQHFYSIGYQLYGHIVIPEEKGYRIYNNQGDKSFDTIVDSYQFLTDQQIQYTVGDAIGILDEDCNVLIESDQYEDVSAPMSGLFFAKKDGKWHVYRDTEVSDKDLYVAPEYVENRGNPYTASYDMSVREEPSKTANKVDRLIHEGETVKVYEIKNLDNGEQWGRLDDNQWVCIQDSENSYLYLDVNNN